MYIDKPAVAHKQSRLPRKTKLAWICGLLCLGVTASAGSEPPDMTRSPRRFAPTPKFKVLTDGSVAPFEIKGGALRDFIAAYAEFTKTVISPEGKWDDVRGGVYLISPRPIPQETLTELFYQVLADNDLTVVDAAQKSGWLVQRMRDARDGVLPIHDSSEVPQTYRMVTAVHHLKAIDSERAARFSRTYMPPASRIVPFPKRELIITDSGANIRKLVAILNEIDTPAAAQRERELAAAAPRIESCPQREQKIEKLTVERLEINENGPGGPPRPNMGRPNGPPPGAHSVFHSATGGGK